MHTGWCGTESGHPSKDVGHAAVWSTGGGYHGDPNANSWEPKFCDPQLFQEHVWFWEPNLKVRTLEMLIPIYHDIVGRGMVMELAFSIDRDGLVQDTHAAMYKALGDWVRTCYGSPLASTSGRGAAVDGATFDIVLGPNTTFDRFQLQEETLVGQRVRNYTVSSWNGVSKGWDTLVTGDAIGTKAIHLLPQPLTTTAEKTKLRLTVDHAIAVPVIQQFAVFAPCASKSKSK
jgi:alpha-L-fucosidase